MSPETISNRLSQYEAQIHEALYPRWNYTGGWIFCADVKENSGLEILLKGYQKEPNPEEKEVIRNKIKTLSVKKELNKIEYQSMLDESAIRFSIWPDPEVEAKEEAKKDIKELVNFCNYLKQAIENKTAQDIQTVFRLFEEAKRGIEQTIQGLGKSWQDTDKQVRDWLDRATQGVGKVVEPLAQTLNEYGQIWRERIVGIIESVDPVKAEEVVKKLQKTYFNEQPSQIANRIIQENAIFATLTGMVGGLVPGASIVVDWLGTNTSLVEMIYQIAVAYGFGNLKSNERKGEIFAIYLTASSSDTLAKLGLEFLKNNTPLAGVAINAGINVIMFYLVGYAACEFYENKAKQKASPITSIEAFTALEEKIETYLDEALTEKKTIDKIVVQAVSMKEQLA